MKELVTGAGELGLFESHLHDTWKEIEEQGMDTCQSSHSSSSENFDSDKDVFEVVDVDSEKDRDAREEAGYEGMRLLLGTQNEETNGQITKSGLLGAKRQVSGTHVQSTKSRVLSVMASQELERDEETKSVSQSVQIGKVGVTWDEIKSAGGIMKLKLIKRESIGEKKLVEDIGERTTARRKGIQRELHNLNFNINYEKGGTEAGPRGDL